MATWAAVLLGVDLELDVGLKLDGAGLGDLSAPMACLTSLLIRRKAGDGRG
jgi:hypothetical protein